MSVKDDATQHLFLSRKQNEENLPLRYSRESNACGCTPS